MSSTKTKSKARTNQPKKKQKPAKTKVSLLKNRRFRLFSVILGGFFVLFLGLVWYIDSLVAKRLAAGDTLEGSRIMSDASYFRSEQKISLPFLRNLLSNRSYRQVTAPPIAPGEYLDSGQSIEVNTRAFEDSSGQIVPGSLTVVSEQSTSDFALEPVSLAPLGSREARATRFLPLSKTPQHLIDAMIAIEDERFYNHLGIDPIGISRAIFTNITRGKLAQGGSTITQQLAKNLFFSSRRSILRKLLEVPAAISLELRLSKPQILEMYLNEVYLGQDGSIAIHGMGEASQAFFAKDPSQLNLAESALLAGLVQAPSLYAPKKYLPRSLKRRDLVLDKMFQLKFITAKQLDEAKRSKPKIVTTSRYKPKIPFYLNAIQENLAEKINLDAAIKHGLQVNTGIQADLQNCAEEAIAKGTAHLERTYPGLLSKRKPVEAALVAIEPYSGKIKAWVGGRNFQRSQFDRVSKASRQIGSTVKPFVYLAALDGTLNSYKTATATSILSDRPMEIELATKKIWTPENYDHEFRGDVTLRYALEHSLNIPAVYVSQRYGVKTLSKVIDNFGLQKNPKDLPAIALGAIDTSLLNLTAAYAALANGGIYVTPRLFISAKESDGQILEVPALEERKLAQEGAVFVLTSILQGVVDRGTGAAIRRTGYKGPAAGKTGTTNDARDAWFVGYTPELAVGVWLGFDDNRKLGLTGGVAAAPIWGDFMSCVSANHSFLDFVPPPSVSLVEIDPESGRSLTKSCRSETYIMEYFVKGTEPKSYCGSDPLPEPRMREDPPRREERELDRPDGGRRSIWDQLFG